MNRAPRLTRRTAATLFAATGLAAFASPRPTQADNMVGYDPSDPRARRASTATFGPPRIPSPVQVQQADGSIASLDMEEYLRGVVPLELGGDQVEALKAQAVAARTYAAVYLASNDYICSTVRCQVWSPSVRSAAADAAVAATRGQVLTYQGGMIRPNYFSTCGGETTEIPDETGVYQKSVRCWREPDGSGRAPLDLSSEAAAAAFWGTTPSAPAFCSFAGLNYRWSFTASRADKEKVLDEALATATTVSPAYARGQLGTLRDLIVLGRAGSGKITTLQIVGSGGAWTVVGETDTRSALSSTPAADGQPLSAARSATAVLSVARDPAGAVSSVTTRGGGFGHGWGMCQSGAIGMARAGYRYADILRQYYTGVELATAPSGGPPVPLATGPRLFLPLGPSRGPVASG